VHTLGRCDRLLLCAGVECPFAWQETAQSSGVHWTSQLTRRTRRAANFDFGIRGRLGRFRPGRIIRQVSAPITARYFLWRFFRRHLSGALRRSSANRHGTRGITRWHRHFVGQCADFLYLIRNENSDLG
jgi:hypothetical protein